MSFFNSVLSSIGNNGPPPPMPLPLPLPRPQVEEPRDLICEQRRIQGQNGVSSANTGVAQNNKRKAEEGLAGRDGKSMRNGMASGQIPRPTSSTNPQTRPSKLPISVSSSIATMPYHGTSRPDPASATPTTPTGDALKAPKKGSYAEIMARAKANQSKPPVGTISHKPKEQIAPSYKKELKLKKKALRDKKLAIKNDSRPGSSGSLSSSPAPGPGANKKVAAPAYKGTAKPKPQIPQPTYKGTMKPASSTAKPSTARDRDTNPRKPRHDEYAATDEDDLNDVEEDEYGSDVSDDMEAGFTDVEQEETVAAKAARKEDEEEARLEAKLKKEKEERRKRLEQLAKKAKPQRY
ncbi:MAG: hypothetical protein ASARMPREDX12_006873 [Alectoria sarmentosa]|nr:MAG: hypothetical protein ASARMPREDX12_006873 [Alectoria sarmentosa]CAD6591327.1 MAG: hypothetical protein ASARMPRED_005312 [Alectoria sarmentosa]